ncbi:1-deoxy-D-xylulose-5-phosphate reductoisomerase [candidate division KSB1 bacterium]|nr:1-deoxy-D-xylulose-5-phosphate reductoisomerase [candidate division KSB1 bacterium]RQW07539.1 MAG: 1-deoxy-D-xylulose-5-phosphate reductoisomerase [candidate division KSB1 bacterium]
MATRKRIIILGSTGSIGANTLSCVDQAPEEYDIIGLSTHRNIGVVLQQVKRHAARAVAVTGPIADAEKKELDKLKIAVFTGPSALVDLVRAHDFDLLVNAVVGAAGFVPTLEALEKKVDIALANKETLVIGGQIVMRKSRENRVQLLPIDSEHSAVFQSLLGENYADIEEVILTASGGPFRTTPAAELKNVTLSQALHHPNWNMGKKITIDSATMMNKGLEVIEARWLFDVAVDQIRVVIHPQSIIHSMVCFVDGSVKAQLGVPDMRIPIQFALTFPRRQRSDFPRIDWRTLRELTFAAPDLDKFRCLALAIAAMRAGGTAPAVLNAANERAVAGFLQQQITFDRIPVIVERAVEKHAFVSHPTVEDLLSADRWAREFVDRLR